MQSDWIARGAAFAAIAAFFGFAVHGAGIGYAPDGDSVRLFESAEAILAGTYERSRSSGYPAFEAAIALILWLGGGVWHVGLYVTALWLATGIALAGLAHRENRWLAPVVLLLTPIVLTNASWQMETAQAAFLTALYLVPALRHGVRYRFLWMTAIGSLLVLTRIDACFAIVAIGCAGLIVERDWRHATTVGTIGLMTLATYATLNGGLGFLGPFETVQDEYWRRLIKAAVIGYVAFAFVGFAMIAILAVRWAKLSPLGRWIVVLVAATWSVRLVLLPEEPEYLIVPLITLMAVFLGLRTRLRGIHILALALVSNVFTPILFERTDPAGDRHHLVFALGQPPVWQDILRRQSYNDALAQETLNFIHDQSGVAVQASAFHNWMVNAERDEIVIFSEAVRVFRSQRAVDMSFTDLDQYRRIVLCDGARIPSRGWRWLRRLELPTVFHARETATPLTCRDVSAAQILTGTY